MKLNRLRIVGFKTFVEPSEFLIEPGLTGVVGPNGCGKSNLVEALRWVMGENSYKSLRASGMDDVIFGGSNTRPARNSAEVVLSIDNSARTAPAHFNDSDVLEVSRKIMRDGGSVYRINGREVRARDVQLLFADAATGARSHAMVRQGQIGEIIAAKPVARRRILEDAAGVAGLYSRRHEAELRLRAAEDNLQRLEDVMREIDGQVDSLRRQARQAIRYRALSAEIRKVEAIGFLIAWRAATAQLATAEEEARADGQAVLACNDRQAQAAYTHGLAAHTLAQARTAEEEAGHELQRRMQELAELEAGERRDRDRAADTARRIAELERDLEREKTQAQDAVVMTARLEDEDAALHARLAHAQDELAEAVEVVAQTQLSLEDSEAEFGRVQAAVADAGARRAALARQIGQEEQRLEKLAAERRRVAGDLDALAAQAQASETLDLLREELEGFEASHGEAEDRALAARTGVATAREAEAALRKPLDEAVRRAQHLGAEAAVLARLVAPAAAGGFAPVLDSVRVEKGFETALGAALGDDLLAATDAAAAVHWADSGEGEADAALPAGAAPLSEVVEAPAVLTRRLRMTGVVSREAGPLLRAHLVPGQRLVSQEGDVWRWDGLTRAADAPSAAAIRLAERNRLADLQREAEEADSEAEARRQALDAAQARTRAADDEEARALDAQRAARRAAESARVKLLDAERAAAASTARHAALEEAHTRLAAGEAQAREGLEAARAELATLPPVDDEALEKARRYAAQIRAAHGESERALQGLQRDIGAQTRRRQAIAAESRAWEERRSRADSVLADVAERLSSARETLVDLTETAEDKAVRRNGLAAAVAEAQAALEQAANARRAAETALAAADESARAALDALASAREARARSQAMGEAARGRLADIIRQIADSVGVAPEALHAHAEHDPEAPLPESQEVDQRLIALRLDRERLGAVNLRAEAELDEAQGKRDGIGAEHDELVEAIRRLRQAIGNLNREGRERLMAAFDVVNGHFQSLFTSLFGGGTADLTLVDSDDPLEAGLEIYARPPGKKPQVLTLLSGGEQALTAIALIFAVFLTNPSPVCVLDEVDAPLDDSNVERYCELLRTMAGQTLTRFIVITHNPITMAAMDRLFGVTMAEKGVSQLVSVDLALAGQILDVG
ncbi:chromosome segregation protein SMC [Pseudochelatococcus lubricantis]|uniref:chromosome segregation protein SMC n=1 Tax=Pseudochelatococcus lubricantis TaxID=1538102 RepID=UPI0035E9053F